MSADYYCYTEVKRKDGSWHALNGLYYNESTGKYELSETFHSGSRTYFSKTYKKMRDIGSSINPKNLSSEVLSKEDWIDPEDHANDVVAVSLNDIRNAIPKTTRHQCCGYVHKSHIWQHETEDIDIDEYLTGEEYDELSDAAKKEYEFFEWDDPMDWYMNLKEILSIVNYQVQEYMDVNNMWSEPSEIRLVCIASY